MKYVPSVRIMSTALNDMVTATEASLGEPLSGTGAIMQ
jgi:hypothetical protein